MSVTPEKVAYSIPEAAAAASFSRAGLYREIAAGRLGRIKIGKRTLITAEALRAWLARAERTGGRRGR